MAEIVRPVAVAGPLQDDLGYPGRVWLVKDAESPQPLWLLGEYRFTREEADRFAAFLNGEDALEAENASLRARLTAAEVLAARWLREGTDPVEWACARELHEVLAKNGLA